jgi:hypothetical protein
MHCAKRSARRQYAIADIYGGRRQSAETASPGLLARETLRLSKATLFTVQKALPLLNDGGGPGVHVVWRQQGRHPEFRAWLDGRTEGPSYSL